MSLDVLSKRRTWVPHLSPDVGLLITHVLGEMHGNDMTAWEKNHIEKGSLRS